MEVIIGKPHGTPTRLDTEERNITVALDTCDRGMLLLGANVVEVTYSSDKGWTLRCSRNVSVQVAPAQDLFVQAGTELTQVHNELHGIRS